MLLCRNVGEITDTNKNSHWRRYNLLKDVSNLTDLHYDRRTWGGKKCTGIRAKIIFLAALKLQTSRVDKHLEDGTPTKMCL